MLDDIVNGGIVDSGGNVTKSIRLLCYFRHRWLDYRHAEILSVASVDAQLKWNLPYGGNTLSPFWYLDLPSLDEARSIARRSLLLKVFVEIWGEGSNFEELRESIESCPEELKTPFYSENVSFGVVVDGWGCKISQAEKVEAIEKLNYLPLRGPVDLKNPREVYWLIIADPNRITGFVGVPYRLYFGRQIAISDMSSIQKYALSQRVYLGPTSMDAEMAMVMCNHGQVKKGSLVVDPFVGTGSILVAAAHFGAVTIGCDIDARILKQNKTNKNGESANIWSNFTSYGLEAPIGLILCDMHHAPFRSTSIELFDAVICDPPYGVRASSKKKSTSKDETGNSHVSQYTINEICRDLLNFAARCLKLGGRLVYFCPSFPGSLSFDRLPQHPMLRPVFCCEQHLTMKYSRYLITMEKTHTYDEAEVRAFQLMPKDPVLLVDNMHEIVFEQRLSDISGKASIPRFRCKQL